jgi:multidrug efflux system membrane fusion protein
LKRFRFWAGGIAVLLILGTAVAYLTLHPREGRGGSSANTAPSRPISVTADIVESKDFPIYRVGLGTVQAYNTVTMKVRVDGEVQKIAFREGQDVQPGDLLAQIDPRPYQALLEQAEADKLRDEALLANAKLDLGRITPLLAHDFATRQSFDTQNTLIAQYQAAIQHDQAVIDNARVQLGYTTIVSPIPGRTGVRLIDQGNIVHTTDASGLVVITQLKPISVIFTLPQQLLPEIADAMRSSRLTVLAYDQNNQLQLGEGQLELVDNQIDQTTGSARFKANFPNEDERLWPGQFVNAWLRVATPRGPVIAASAVQTGPDGDFAYVIQQDASIKMHPLRVTAVQQGQALIETGLAPGERVVVDGHYKLRPGARVADDTKSTAPGGEKKTTAQAGVPAQ